MDLAGNTAALAGDGGAGLLFVQLGELLEFLEVSLGLGVRAHARLDELPHELGARSADHGYSDPVELEQRVLNFRIAGDVDDQVHFLRAQQVAEVPRHGNAVAFGQAQAWSLGIDLGHTDDANQRVRGQDRQERRAPGARADNGHVGDAGFGRVRTGRRLALYRHRTHSRVEG
ncbi:MAG: hypothetical protein AUH95_02395 [Nitrospirae bacterium 13_2_20CM_2_63_8]|nr:MAG: hypothetical protein AUH95_02395 [Nitrospirae bacterium 13_2_20CM_2_63_8]